MNPESVWTAAAAPVVAPKDLELAEQVERGSVRSDQESVLEAVQELVSVVAWLDRETVEQDWANSVRALVREVVRVSGAPVVPAVPVEVPELAVLDWARLEQARAMGVGPDCFVR